MQDEGGQVESAPLSRALLVEMVLVCISKFLQ